MTKTEANWTETDSDPQKRYAAVRDKLNKAVHDYAEKEDIGARVLALLLVDLGVTAYMLDYVIMTEKPSTLGLKLELDRFGREIEHFIRSTKKDADNFVRHVKEFLSTVAAAEASEAASQGKDAPRAA